MYVYIYIYVHIFIYIYVRTHTCVYTHTKIHTHQRQHMNSRTNMPMYTHNHTDYSTPSKFPPRSLRAPVCTLFAANRCNIVALPFPNLETACRKNAWVHELKHTRRHTNIYLCVYVWGEGGEGGEGLGGGGDTCMHMYMYMTNTYTYTYICTYVCVCICISTYLTCLIWGGYG